MTTVSELVDKGDIPEERKDNVKRVLHDLGYAASRAVGKAFLKITKKDMTDADMSIADANAILAEVEPLQGVSIVQDTNEEQFFCKVKVNGPLGHFCGNLLIDTGCTMELNLSEHKAFQLGITAATKQSACELGDCSTSGITCRGAALVEVFVEVAGQIAFSHDHQAWLEVWTDDGSLPVSAHHFQRPVATGGQILGQMSLAVQEYSHVKSGKDRHGQDLIIGKPGMLKLGLGIDARTGHLCNVKRRMRK